MNVTGKQTQLLTVVGAVLLAHDEVVDAEVATRVLEVLTAAHRLHHEVLEVGRNTDRFLHPK